MRQIALKIVNMLASRHVFLMWHTEIKLLPKIFILTHRELPDEIKTEVSTNGFKWMRG